ncbi:MAG: ADP-ribosylglycohydrolase family protein [Planctomycetaceae bacterium]
MDISDRTKLARLSLKGLSIGDAFGQQFFATPELLMSRQLPTYPWTITDDTVMAVSVVETLEEEGHIAPDLLAQKFAERYSADPWRGYGGTAHGILQRIGKGVAWQVAAGEVFDGAGSMGNGGAMRAGPIGGFFADDIEACIRNARLSAIVTHAHPDGQAGAIAVAVAAATAHDLHSTADPRQLLEAVIQYTPEGPTHSGLKEALETPLDYDVRTAAAKLGSGGKVISSDTVPFSLWCAAKCLRNYEEAMWTTVADWVIETPPARLQVLWSLWPLAATEYRSSGWITVSH